VIQSWEFHPSKSREVDLSDEFYRKLVEKSPLAYAYHRILTDSDGIPNDYEFLEINPAFEAITGLSPQQTLYRRVTEVIPGIKDHDFDWIAQYGQVARQGGEICFKQYSKPLDRWFHVHAFSPKPDHFVTLFSEIGDTIRIEQTLQERDSVFHLLFEGDHVVVLAIDPDTGAICDANPAACRFYGWSREQMKTMNLDEINVLSREEIRRNLEMTRSGTKNHFHFQHRIASGEIREIEVTTGPIQIGSRKLVYSIIQDITERVRAETARQESEERFRSLFETMDQGVLYRSREGKIITANAAAGRILGIPLERLIGSAPIDRLWEIFHPDGREIPSDEYPPVVALRTGKPVYNEIIRVESMDGSATRWLQLTSIPRTQKGEDRPSGVFSTFTDITERIEGERILRAAKLKAEESNRAKSEFLANMSHEIRTPLNGVIGFLSLLDASPLESTQREYLQNALTSSRSLLSILNDVLDFSKIEAGRMETEPVPTDLSELASRSLDCVRFQAGQKGLHLLLRTDPGLPSVVRVDQVRLGQILINLLGNAVKFTSRGEVELSISWRPHPDDETRGTATFSVADSGIGISPEQQENLFRAFSQADTSITRNYGGTGLGLAISKRLANLLGGDISLRSTLGEGSTFTFELDLAISSTPKCEERPSFDPEQDALRPLPDAPGRKPTILVAEDIAMNMALIRAMLAIILPGCILLEAQNGAEAVKLFGEHEVDLVLMDVQMPVLDGYGATRAIRSSEDGRKTPILALTASTVFGESDRGFAAGMNAFLTKPVDAHQLRAALARWLEPQTKSGSRPSAEGADRRHFNREDLLARTGLGEDFTRTLLVSAREELPQKLGALEDFARRGSCEDMSRAAHGVKGMSLNLGFEVLADLAKAMQQLADSRASSQKMSEVAGRMNAEWELVLRELA
jgi:PAS domain S-box-containing protein